MNSIEKHDLSQLIKAKAIELGFDACGIASAERLENEEPLLKAWLEKGFNGQMAYMANNLDKRLDPRYLTDNGKSVIVVLFYYYPPSFQNEAAEYKIGKYAYGKDYHITIKEKLNLLGNYISQIAPGHTYRVFADSAPVLEKAWAKKAGLGWTGKHSLLIVPRRGSFFFIGEMITTLDLEPDRPFVGNLCGSCTRCINACPTKAITEPGKIDARKCIAYLTMELKDDQLPEEFSGLNKEWIFACDACQDACPWNKALKPHTHADFQPNMSLLNLSKQEWDTLTQERFDEIFKDSAIKRAKYSGLKRNIDFLKDKNK
ncbi:MAG: tRNA epoxyqueuosine(34) reductase QueG [Bacteroidota bacterium]|nr:tRNA epoxyqueuosine(34) reductase QueG [Bacteroidota bacterium]